MRKTRAIAYDRAEMRDDPASAPEGRPFPGETCVLGAALDRWADLQPEKVFAVFSGGPSWTYRDLRRIVRRTAAGFQRLGVRQGEPVLLWLPNGPDILRCAFALGYVGAVAVPINTAYKGRLLEHVIANAGARLIVVHASLLPLLAEVELHAVETILVLGEGALGAISGRPVRSIAALDEAGDALRPPERPVAPWDTQWIIYTSGTTGPSKGVLASYMHAYSSVGPETWTCLAPEDRFFINLPFFHIGGAFICHAVLCGGGSIAMVERFSTERFWDEVRETGATIVFLLGVMANFLLQAPPGPRDKDHPLRKAFIVPFAKEALPFGERFGVTIWTLFNMTEIATPTFSGPNPTKPGGCGRKRPGVEIRLVDEHDWEVPRGAVGEMILRTDRPWAMNHGYHKDAEATQRAWRNGWFHTGDAFFVDADGEYVFVDRLKDAIRRRGENISSFEIEAELLAYPGVREAAAIPVPAEHGEDEVMAVLALAPGAAAFDHAQFIEFLAARVAHFMVPRYVRVLPELPKTPTAKVQKALLRRDGVTPDTWDRIAAGITLRQARLQRR
jgi:crotonobetaine/carnitine-CoA ligase